MRRPVYLVVVTFNSADHIDRLLKSVPAAAARHEVVTIVVDNRSTDDTLERLNLRTDVTAVDAGGNVGYSAAINIARRMVPRGSAVLVLNPDQVLLPGAIDELVDVLDLSSAAPNGVGVVVPRLVDPAGDLAPHLRREPTVATGLGDAVFGDHFATRPVWLSETLRDPARYGADQSVDWAAGAALLVSARCNEAVGDWREDFFLYAEETDFMARVRDAGFEVRYASRSTVEHTGAGSGSSAALIALMTVNRVRYYRSRHGRVPSAAFAGTMILNHLLRVHRKDSRVTLAALVSPRRRRLLPSGERPDPRVISPAGDEQPVR